MIPNKFITSGSPLQIPTHPLGRPPTAPADAPLNGGAQRLTSEPVKQAGHLTVTSQDPALGLADFSATNLSNQQVIVLRAIASGKGISAAAQEAGVSRPTIYRWQRDPHFQKWLAAWQAQTKESGRNIMLTLIERSTRIVERALDKDDVRVALTVLTKFGVLTDRDIPAVAIVSEGTSNELESKSGAVPRAGEIERR